MISKEELNKFKKMRELLGNSDEAFNTLIECVNIINFMFYEDRMKIAEEPDPQKRGKMALNLVKKLYNYWNFENLDPEQIENLSYN